MNLCKHDSQNCKLKCRENCGGYCWKHRKLFLLDDNKIRLDRLTKNSKDYTIKELESYYKSIYGKKKSGYSKDDYFKHLFELKERFNHSSIVRVQSLIRLFIQKQRVNMRGIGYICRHICNNDEDFYTYDSKESIEGIYFFSYKDSNNNVWCFDIRSAKKLIDMNYGNPYTTEPIPEVIQDKINNLITKLQNNKIKTNIQNEMIKDRKISIKQKYVDIISQLEINTGYACEIEWILSLNIAQLKRLYREWEDIWNYRAYLSHDVKCAIVPPNGILFPYSPNEINAYPNTYLSKYNLLDIISSQLSKIMANNNANSTLGFMYFIMALSMVNLRCAQIHGWWVSVTI